MLEIKAMVADMLNLPFTDDTFDVVIEKGTMVRKLVVACGCTYSFFYKSEILFLVFWLLICQVWINLSFKDVLFVDSGDPWNPKAETVSRALAMLEGIHRVLKPDGIFISISFGQVLQFKTFGPLKS